MSSSGVIRKRYLYLALGAVMLILLGLLYAWSIFKKPLTEVFASLNDFELSMTFTLSMIFLCLGGFFSGRLADRLSYKKRLFLAAVMIFIGFFCLSLSKPANHGDIAIKLYIFYGFFCGFGVGIGYNVIISAVVQWFPDRVGFASGVLLMGFGMGGMIFGSLVNYIVAKTGIMSTFFVLSLLIPVTIIAATLFLSEPNEDEAAWLKALVPSRNKSLPQAVDKKPSEMLLSGIFWCYMCWTILISASGLLVLNNAAQIVMMFGAPAVLGLIMSVFNGAGRVIIGILFDRIGGPKTAFVNGLCLLASGIALYTGNVINSLPLIISGLALCGISFGGGPSITSALIKQVFGSKYYPVNFSLGNFALIPSALIGPLISGFLFNRSGGSYSSTFIMMIIFALITLLLSVILAKLIKRNG